MKAISASALGWMQLRRQHAAVSHAHVVEQHAEIGLVHAELLLHGLGRQARLAADDLPSLRFPETGVDFLNPIGPDHIDRIEIIAQGRNHAPGISVAQRFAAASQVSLMHSRPLQTAGSPDRRTIFRRKGSWHQPQAAPISQHMRKQIPLLAATSRALAMLEAVIEDGGASSVSALARKHDVPVATAHRQVATLVSEGFLAPTGGGRHIAGPACAPFLRVSMTSSW
jgi:hypothetical protein